MGFFQGLKDLALGVGQVVVGIGKAAFAFLKFMLFSAVCVIVGIYNAAKAIFNFAKKAYRKLKQKRPNVKVESSGSATKKVIGKVMGDIKKEIAADTIKLSELEKEEVIADVNQIEKKIELGEANGMLWIAGKNEKGENEIFDAELTQIEQLSPEDKRRDDTETSYVQNFA